MRRPSGRTGLAAVLALAAGCGTSPERTAEDDRRFVALGSEAPSIVRDLRYAGAGNFLGRPVDGYRAPRCLLTPVAAAALARVQRDLAPTGLGLVVFDCYRPQRAVDDFVRWAADPDETTRTRYYPNVPKSELFAQGYIAERSSHSRGSTVDVGLLRRGARPSELVDMGTPFDFFDPRSHTASREVTESQRANRLRLRDAMERRGFRNYPKEWWHYTLADEPYPDDYFDDPVE